MIAYIDHRNQPNNIYISLGDRPIFSVNVDCIRIAFLVFWFMAAFRGLDITNDTSAYYYTYQKIQTMGFAGETRMEIGYVALNVLLAKLFPIGETGFWVLHFVTASISYFAIEKWIEKHAKTFGVCILVFYFLFNAVYMSAIRQSLACAIVLFALNFLERKKHIHYIICVFISTMFHQTAWVALCFILFFYIKFSKYIAGAMIGVSIVATLTNATSFLVKYLYPDTIYLTSEIVNLQNVIVMSLMYLALLGIQIFRRHSLADKQETKIVDVEGFYAYCIVAALCITILSLRTPVLSRFSIYFTLSGLPYISNTISEFGDVRTANIVKVTLCGVLWAYSLIVLLYRPEWQHLWPHHFYWSTY